MILLSGKIAFVSIQISEKTPNLNPARPDHSAAREAAWVGP